MLRLIRLALVIGLLLALALAAGPAAAGHQHWLQTPGTCVEDIASGQTRISDPDHGGYHRFHNNVHIGQPGAAFENPKNPVAIDRGEACPAD
jgi:hypothetical protein